MAVSTRPEPIIPDRDSLEHRRRAQITVHVPHERLNVGFFQSWRVMFLNVMSCRELIAQLFRRDFLAVYKKSFLGFVWVALLPILGVVPLIFMQAAEILRPGVQGVPYVAFAVLSISLWQMFAGTITLCTQALSTSSSLILQVRFPHEVLLVKQCAQQLAVSIVALTLSMIALFAFGITPDWKSVLLPIMLVPIVLLASGIGLVLAVLSVVTSDLERALIYVLQLLLYVTPVVYTADVKYPALQKLIDWNPLTYLIGDARDIVLFGAIRHLDRYAYACGFALVVFLCAWRVFYLSEQHVVERLG
jgi:ABC-type polysaccharide/polyol phosphate export permease